MLQVQAKQCETCIFKKGFHWHLKRLLDDIRDPHMAGYFRGHRICHHSKNAVCAGFWKRYKDHFDLGQVAQRLGLVEYVEHDDEQTRTEV